MASFPSQEHRPLKKPRLGLLGPDVYPQDKKQKEVIECQPCYRFILLYRNEGIAKQVVRQYTLVIQYNTIQYNTISFNGTKTPQLTQTQLRITREKKLLIGNVRKMNISFLIL